MSGALIRAGFMALVDSAPLIVARELGFAAEEGITLELERAPSWSALRDLVVMGRVEAAHMLAPVPVGMALGIGGGAGAGRLDAAMVLSTNGNVIGVSQEIARALRAAGYGFDFADPHAAGQGLIALGRKLRIGVPFPFSMHAELLYYWLAALGISAPQSLSVHTVPPPLMAEAMAAGEIDMFCVGEPWGTAAVEGGMGELLLPMAAIWGHAPEKVLALRHGWIEAEPELTGQLMRAVWRAARWLGEAGNQTTAAEIIARKAYVDTPAEWISRALSGNLIISGQGESRPVPGFLNFHDGAANFPWRSQAAWIGQQMAARLGLDREAAAQSAREVFRTDLYRAHLASAGAVMPVASEKLEGALGEPTAIGSVDGRLILRPDRFFDGTVFDPSVVT